MASHDPDCIYVNISPSRSCLFSGCLVLLVLACSEDEGQRKISYQGNDQINEVTPIHMKIKEGGREAYPDLHGSVTIATLTEK